MSPEVAMEEYIKTLSDADPGWDARFKCCEFFFAYEVFLVISNRGF